MFRKIFENYNFWNTAFSLETFILSEAGFCAPHFPQVYNNNNFGQSCCHVTTFFKEITYSREKF